jgi:hypothetical protein
MSDTHPKDPNPEKAEPFDVFVSYAREDSEVAQRLVETLEHSGVRCWLDKISLQPGEPWIPQIRDAIDRSRSFVVVVSGSTVASTPSVSTEWSAIQESCWRRQDVSVFPVTVGKVDVPPFLRQWQTFRIDKPNASVEGITEAISARLSTGGEQKQDQRAIDDASTVKRFRDIESVLTAGRTEEQDSSSDE